MVSGQLLHGLSDNQLKSLNQSIRVILFLTQKRKIFLILLLEILLLLFSFILFISNIRNLLDSALFLFYNEIVSSTVVEHGKHNSLK